MKTLPLLDDLVFSEMGPHAEPLLVDESGRVLRFTLRPGQAIKRHRAPTAEVHIIVLAGSGMFAGSDDEERLLGAHQMVVFRAGEFHTVRALDEDLVFIALLPSVRHAAVRRPSPEAEAYLTWHT